MFSCADGDWLLKRGTCGRAKPQKQWEEMRPKTGEDHWGRKTQAERIRTDVSIPSLVLVHLIWVGGERR